MTIETPRSGLVFSRHDTATEEVIGLGVRGYVGTEKVLRGLEWLPLGEHRDEVTRKFIQAGIEINAVCRDGGALSTSGQFLLMGLPYSTLEPGFTDMLVERRVVAVKRLAASTYLGINLWERGISHNQNIYIYTPGFSADLGVRTTPHGSALSCVTATNTSPQWISPDAAINPFGNRLKHLLTGVVTPRVELPVKSFVNQVLIDIALHAQSGIDN